MRQFQLITRISRLFSSVFVKLLLVCLLAWLLIAISVSVLFISYRFIAGAPYTPLVAHYLEYLVTDIGGQPERAAQIATQLGISIDCQSPQSHWSSGGEPLPAQIHFFQTPNDDALAYGFRHDVKYIRYQHQTGTYVFTLPDHEGDWLQSSLHYLALAIIALVFAGAYFLIRRILSPISTLHEATQRVGKGELNHEVDVPGNSELAKLADSFNQMVRQVREMITAKEQLLRDVSHELRSPLTRIKFLLEMVDPPERAEQIRSDIKELEELITSILETARNYHQLDNLRIEELDLYDLVARVIDRHRETGADIILESSDLPVMARIDRHLFTRVVENLIANALTHGQPATGPPVVRVAPENGGIKLIVTDNGPGIREQDLPHLMEPFYQADKSRSREKSGFGLGLSLCKAIVTAHEGELILTSTPGQGTEALVLLPEGRTRRKNHH